MVDSEESRTETSVNGYERVKLFREEALQAQDTSHVWPVAKTRNRASMFLTRQCSSLLRRICALGLLFSLVMDDVITWLEKLPYRGILLMMEQIE